MRKRGGGQVLAGRQDLIVCALHEPLLQLDHLPYIRLLLSLLRSQGLFASQENGGPSWGLHRCWSAAARNIVAEDPTRQRKEWLGQTSCGRSSSSV